MQQKAGRVIDPHRAAGRLHLIAQGRKPASFHDGACGNGAVVPAANVPSVPFLCPDDLQPLAAGMAHQVRHALVYRRLHQLRRFRPFAGKYALPFDGDADRLRRAYQLTKRIRGRCIVALASSSRMFCRQDAQMSRAFSPPSARN